MNTQGITQGIQPMIHQGNHFTNIGHMTNHITYLSSNDQFPIITQGITQGNPIFTRVLPRVIHCSLPPIHQGNDQLTYHYITNHWYYRILIIHQGIHQGNDQGKRQGNDQGNIAVAWDSDDFWLFDFKRQNVAHVEKVWKVNKVWLADRRKRKLKKSGWLAAGTRPGQARPRQAMPWPGQDPAQPNEKKSKSQKVKKVDDFWLSTSKRRTRWKIQPESQKISPRVKKSKKFNP